LASKENKNYNGVSIETILHLKNKENDICQKS